MRRRDDDHDDKPLGGGCVFVAVFLLVSLTLLRLLSGD